jgi:hypothetical protein
VSHINFGRWDLNSSGLIDSPPQGVLPSTPLRLSQEQGSSPISFQSLPLTPQLARRTFPFRHSVSPIQEDVRYPSPELTYPEAPDQAFPTSNARSEEITSVFQSPILAPVAFPASEPIILPSPVSRPLSPHCLPHAPPSPIDSPINWDNLLRSRFT